MKYIIWKEGFGYKMTSEANYNAYIMDANKVSNFDEFTTAQEVIDYCVKYFGGSADDYREEV